MEYRLKIMTHKKGDLRFDNKEIAISLDNDLSEIDEAIIVIYNEDKHLNLSSRKEYVNIGKLKCEFGEGMMKADNNALRIPEVFSKQVLDAFMEILLLTPRNMRKVIQESLIYNLKLAITNVQEFKKVFKNTLGACESEAMINDLFKDMGVKVKVVSIETNPPPLTPPILTPERYYQLSNMGVKEGNIELMKHIKGIIGLCPFCKNEIKPFKTQLSYREFFISGICQDCQDKLFVKPKEDQGDSSE